MRRVMIPVLLILAALGVVVFESIQRQPNETIPWRTDFASASAEAKRTGKPMLLDFSATWCGPCQDMRRTTWSDRQVAQDLAGYVPVQIDLDHNPALAQRFSVSAIPHLDLIEPNGQVIASTEGEMNPDEFRAWLAAAHSDSVHGAHASSSAIWPPTTSSSCGTSSGDSQVVQCLGAAKHPDFTLAILTLMIQTTGIGHPCHCRRSRRAP